MQIIDGKLYLNRTWKYIYPALRVYGFQPISYLNELIKQSVGISDINFQEEDKIPKIFILIQTRDLRASMSKAKEYETKVSKFFEYIRNQEYYIDDYLYDINSKCCSHMVVLRFPDTFGKKFNNFVKGEYSKMYTQEEIKKYFPLASLNKSKNITISNSLGDNLEIHKVFTKEPEFKKIFIDKINKDFGLEMSENEFDINMELDYLPTLEEELFNYKKQQLLLS